MSMQCSHFDFAPNSFYVPSAGIGFAQAPGVRYANNIMNYK